MNQKFLFLTTILPFNKKTGGEIASAQFIESLRTFADVDVVGYTRKNDSQSLSTNDYNVNERIIESNNSLIHMIFWLLLSIIKRTAFSSEKYDSPEYKRTVIKLLNDNHYDIIFIDHAQVAFILETLPLSSKCIFIAHNIEEKIYTELSHKTSNFLFKNIYKYEAYKISILENKLIDYSLQTWVLTDDDQSYFSTHDKGKKRKIYTLKVPGGFDNYLRTNLVHDIGILGTWSWESNKQGLEWFLKEVKPFINKKYKVFIGGKNSDYYTDTTTHIYGLGYVDNAQSFLSSCKVLVIPTTSGGGIQIKTLDAISVGQPIVLTPIAIRGIDNLPKNINIIEDPLEFAAMINRILANNIQADDSGYKWSKLRKEKFLIDIKHYTSQLL